MLLLQLIVLLLELVVSPGEGGVLLNQLTLLGAQLPQSLLLGVGVGELALKALRDLGEVLEQPLGLGPLPPRRGRKSLARCCSRAGRCSPR